MTPHHVLPRLAEYFHVLWLEPPHHWRDWREARIQRRRVASHEEPLPSGFEVYVPGERFPDVHRLKRTKKALAQLRFRKGWARLEKKGCTARVLYLWHPRSEEALHLNRHHASLYHIDDEYSFSPDPPLTSPAEARVILTVDSVIVTSPHLLARKGGINPNTIMIPEGVDFALYSRPAAEPSDLRSIPHPRIGYTGVLKPHLDWSLLLRLARERPNWSFVFVGPNHLEGEDLLVLQQLAGMANVHFLGFKGIADLARYPQHFDVCLMPYRVNGYTHNVYPLKLHEYLAGGRPVVGAPIDSLRSFGSVIELAQGTEEWLQAISTCLGSRANDPLQTQRRQAVARRHDWSGLVYRLAVEICSRLGPAFLDRLHPLAEVPAASACESRLEPDPHSEAPAAGF